MNLKKEVGLGRKHASGKRDSIIRKY